MPALPTGTRAKTTPLVGPWFAPLRVESLRVVLLPVVLLIVVLLPVVPLRDRKRQAETDDAGEYKYRSISHGSSHSLIRSVC